MIYAILCSKHEYMSAFETIACFGEVKMCIQIEGRKVKLLNFYHRDITKQTPFCIQINIIKQRGGTV